MFIRNGQVLGSALHGAEPAPRAKPTKKVELAPEPKPEPESTTVIQPDPKPEPVKKVPVKSAPTKHAGGAS